MFVWTAGGATASSTGLTGANNVAVRSATAVAPTPAPTPTPAPVALQLPKAAAKVCRGQALYPSLLNQADPECRHPADVAGELGARTGTELSKVLTKFVWSGHFTITP